MHTYEELIAQSKELQAQAEQLRQQEKGEKISQIKQIMATYGITPADLGAKRKAPASKAMYRDPSTGKSWSGRGRQPQWIKDMVAQTGSAESARVQ